MRRRFVSAEAEQEFTLPPSAPNAPQGRLVPAFDVILTAVAGATFERGREGRQRRNASPAYRLFEVDAMVAWPRRMFRVSAWITWQANSSQGVTWSLINSRRSMSSATAGFVLHM